MKTCHECKVREGQIHELGCDMEFCPKCGNQLISCDCYVDPNSLTGEWNPSIHKVKRVPYFSPPVRCHTCGKETNLWMLDDEVWEAVTPKEMQNEVLCKKCFKRIYNIRKREGTLFEDVNLPRGF